MARSMQKNRDRMLTQWPAHIQRLVKESAAFQTFRTPSGIEDEDSGVKIYLTGHYKAKTYEEAANLALERLEFINQERRANNVHPLMRKKEIVDAINEGSKEATARLNAQ